MKIRVLLLGVGRWGVNHLRLLHSLPVELFVAEIYPERLAQARALGIPDTHLFHNYREISASVDAMVVVTSANTHFELCREFLEAGKDVFVEKPITLQSEEARILVALAERHNRILQVGHIFRYDPASQWLRNSIQQGSFGRIKILRGNFSGFKRPRSDTGVTFADAIHFIDLFNYFMGRSPARVNAILKDFMGRSMDDASLVTMDYDGDDGTTWATVESSYYPPGKYREVVVVGEELSAVCDYNIAQYKIKTFGNKHIKDGGDSKAVEGAVHQIEFPPEEPLRMELRAFIESIQTRKHPLADGRSGFEAVRIVEAALKSAKEGRTIELNR